MYCVSVGSSLATSIYAKVRNTSIASAAIDTYDKAYRDAAIDSIHKDVEFV